MTLGQMLNDLPKVFDRGANLIGQWISIIQRTPSSGAKISPRDHDFVIKKSRHEVA